MGIPCQQIQFSTAAPDFDAVYEAICEIEGTDVPAIVRRLPSRPLSPNRPPVAPVSLEAASRRFADESLYLYATESDLRINVTEDRQNIYLIGGPKGLRQSSCRALEELGGRAVQPTPLPRKRKTLREWAWLLFVAPFGLLVALCFVTLLAIMVLISIRIMFIAPLRDRRREKRLRRRIASAGRWMPASQVDAKLNSGEGTLIIEHLLPKGFTREWWTEDDLIGDSPVPLPTSPIGPPDGNRSTSLNEYALSCAMKYTGPRAGTARLTKTVPELSRSHRKLAEKYPRAKIVVLFVFEWATDQSLIFRRDLLASGFPEADAGLDF